MFFQPQQKTRDQHESTRVLDLDPSFVFLGGFLLLFFAIIIIIMLRYAINRPKLPNSCVLTRNDLFYFNLFVNFFYVNSEIMV